MTAQLTKEQFIEFVEDLYLGKLTDQPTSQDIGGYHVKITDSRTVPGRYTIEVHGPVGDYSSRHNVSALGLAWAAAAVYDAINTSTNMKALVYTSPTTKEIVEFAEEEAPTGPAGIPNRPDGPGDVSGRIGR